MRCRAGMMDELVRLCGQLPLAIRVAGARLRHRPGWTVEHLADRLRNQLLAELRTDHRDVAAVLAMSCRQLDEDLVRTFALLGLFPAADFDVYGVAALAGATYWQADAALQGLVDAHLVQEISQDRYRMHDLVRHYAAELAADIDEGIRRDRLGRLLDHFLHAATAAMDLIVPDERHRRPVVGPATASPAKLADKDTAAAWLDAEVANLVGVAGFAADNGWPSFTVDLSAILWRYLSMTSRNGEARALHERALATAREQGDHAGEVQALNSLSDLKWRSGRNREAFAISSLALDIARATDDRAGECFALNSLAVLHKQFGDLDQAEHTAREAVRAARAIGDRNIETRALLNLGVNLWMQGHAAEAIDRSQQALDLARRTGDGSAATAALTNLAEMCTRQGDHERAIASFHEALAIARRLGERKGEGHALHGLAEAYLRSGDLDGAATSHRQALEIARDTKDPALETEVLIGLAVLARHSGELESSIETYREAAALAIQIGDRYHHARAIDGLGGAYSDGGDLDAAAEQWRTALRAFEDLGVADADEVRERLLAIGD